MIIRTQRYPTEEYARRGNEIFERVVKPRLQLEDVDRYLAIDIDSEDYQLDADDYMVTERLRERHPDAQIWLMRVGHPAAYRIGPIGNGGMG